MAKDTDTFDWEGDAAGGSVSAYREDREFSPAAGDSDTADADRDHVQEDTPTTHEDDAGGDVGLTPTGAIRGTIVDAESGSEFVRGKVTYVAPEHVERLLGYRRRGAPVLVRTDS